MELLRERESEEQTTVCEESKFETTRVDDPRGALAMPIQETKKEALSRCR